MFPLVRLIPENTTIPFMRMRVVAYPVVAFLLAVSLIAWAIQGLNFGVDFRGGTIIEVEAIQGPADIAAVRDVLAPLDLGDVQIQNFGSEDHLLIRLGTAVESVDANEAVAEVRAAIGDQYSLERIETVGPSVSGELVNQSALALGLGAVAIFIYLWLRFEWQFALGAIITTIHDVIMTIGLFALLQIDFDLTSVAAVLTIMGYSLNDTVVVYDRIRESMRRYKKRSMSDILDVAINATLSRTIITSLTTLVAALTLFLFGGEVLRGFSMAMLFGVIVGTYSTVFIAAPLLIHLNLRPEAELAEKSAETAPSRSTQVSGG